jgi:hypothetical protein
MEFRRCLAPELLLMPCHVNTEPVVSEKGLENGDGVH